MFISYAQNFEDVILHRALRHIEKGFYIDVGAQDECIDSVSRGFYEQGWRGVHVEPVAEYAQKMRELRDGDTVIEAAISAVRGRLGFFAIAGTGISTGDMAIAQGHRAAGFDVSLIEVESIPLSQVLDDCADRDIHWLKIDVEGMEGQVIESWPPSKVRPWIVVVESTRPGSSEPSHQAWEPNLLGLGYDYVYFDGVNRFYVSHEHRELKSAFGAGPNFFDDFALSTTNWMSRLSGAELKTAALQLEDQRALRSQAEAKAMTLQTELEQAIALLRDNEAELSRLTPLAAQLNEREGEVARLSATVAKMRAEASGTVSKVKHDLMTTRMELINAQKELGAKTAEIASIKSSIAEEQARAGREFERGENFRRMLDEMAITSNNQERRINELQASTSWRLTRPLRGVKSGSAALLSLPRAAVRGVLERMLLQHRKRPALAGVLRTSAALIPPLDRRLRKFSSLRLPATHLAATDHAVEQPSAQWWAKTHFCAESTIPPSPLMLRAGAIAAELERARPN